MYPAFELFGVTIPSYWLCFLAGISVCSIVALFRRKRFEELQEVDITNSAALLFIGVLIGSRLLYLITILPVIIRNYRILVNDLPLAYEVLSNGMVFYGGMLGALFVLYRYAGKYRIDTKALFDFYAPLFPLFHCFGRIGCFLNGCCHGVVSEKYGIPFHNSISAVNDVPYFPIQLVCSLGNLLIFFTVLLYEKTHHRHGHAMYLYLIVYAPCRFIVEFFRGDAVRGFLLGLSTSQWISIVIIIVFTFQAITSTKRKKSHAASE